MNKKVIKTPVSFDQKNGFICDAKQREIADMRVALTYKQFEMPTKAMLKQADRIGPELERIINAHDALVEAAEKIILARGNRFIKHFEQYPRDRKVDEEFRAYCELHAALKAARGEE